MKKITFILLLLSLILCGCNSNNNGEEKVAFRLLSTHYDASGNVTMTSSVEYNEKEQPIKVTNADGNVWISQYEDDVCVKEILQGTNTYVEYIYNNKKEKIQEKQYEDGNVLMITDYEYDDSGNWIHKTVEYKKYPEASYEAFQTFNNQNLLVENRSVFLDGTENRYTVEYQDDVASRWVIYEKGELYKSTEYFYENGLKIKSISDYEDVHQVEEFEYDEDERLIKQTFYLNDELDGWVEYQYK